MPTRLLLENIYGVFIFHLQLISREVQEFHLADINNNLKCKDVRLIIDNVSIAQTVVNKTDFSGEFSLIATGFSNML